MVRSSTAASGHGHTRGRIGDRGTIRDQRPGPVHSQPGNPGTGVPCQGKWESCANFLGVAGEPCQIRDSRRGLCPGQRVSPRRSGSRAAKPCQKPWHAADGKCAKTVGVRRPYSQVFAARDNRDGRVPAHGPPRITGAVPTPPREVATTRTAAPHLPSGWPIPRPARGGIGIITDMTATTPGAAGPPTGNPATADGPDRAAAARLLTRDATVRWLTETTVAGIGQAVAITRHRPAAGQHPTWAEALPCKWSR